VARQPPHRRPCQRTPADTGVHVGMHASGGEGRVAGTSEKVGAGVGVGVVVGGTCPNVFSTLVGSREGG